MPRAEATKKRKNFFQKCGSVLAQLNPCAKDRAAACFIRSFDVFNKNSAIRGLGRALDPNNRTNKLDTFWKECSDSERGAVFILAAALFAGAYFAGSAAVAVLAEHGITTQGGVIVGGAFVGVVSNKKAEDEKRARQNRERERARNHQPSHSVRTMAGHG